MIDAEIFRIMSVAEIIKELFQVKEIFMEHLNNIDIISDIQNFAVLLKVKKFCFRYKTLSLLNLWSQGFFVWPLI